MKDLTMKNGEITMGWTSAHSVEMRASGNISKCFTKITSTVEA
jgi:hypothetical protein